MNIWVGPTGDDPRDPNPERWNYDYLPVMTDRSKWAALGARTSTVELYMGCMQDVLAKETSGWNADSYLKPLASALADKSIGMQVLGLTVGVDGMIQSATTDTVPGNGPATASQCTLPVLRRWKAAGGRLDFLTTDNAISHALVYQGANPRVPALTRPQLYDELGRFFAAVRAEFPGVALGFTEAGTLVTSDDGSIYPCLPGWPDTGEVMDGVVAAAKTRGAPLNHFFLETELAPDDGVDCPRSTHRFPSGNDYGRMLTLERMARQRGLKVGAYLNLPVLSTGYADLLSRMTVAAGEYVQSGARPDYLALEQWGGTDHLGSETVSGGEMFLNSQVLAALTSAQAGPAVPYHPDNPVTLGMRFYSDVPGLVSGVKFYRGDDRYLGPFLGGLFDSAGKLLAQAQFTTQGTGWQTMTFSAPVPIAAGLQYVAAYNSPSGFAYDPSFSGMDRGGLHAPANSNGVYAYGSGLNCPATVSGNNYWIDIVFSPVSVSGLWA
jgi:hypothetical protein